MSGRRDGAPPAPRRRRDGAPSAPRRRGLVLAALGWPCLAMPLAAFARTPAEGPAREGPERRSALAGAQLLAQSQADVPAPARLPLRNLRVELRHGEASELRRSGGGIERGAVVVGPDGELQARGGVTLESRRHGGAGGGTQQVTVLNGGQAAVRVGLSVPMRWLQWGWSPEGPVLVGGSQYVETGSGFLVQPRWPGGDAPVTVELRTEASARASAGLPSPPAPDGQPLPDGALQQAGVLTTVQVPLGEWITVASSGDTQARRERGVRSTRELASTRRLVLEMRVTAP